MPSGENTKFDGGQSPKSSRTSAVAAFARSAAMSIRTSFWLPLISDMDPMRVAPSGDMSRSNRSRP